MHHETVFRHLNCFVTSLNKAQNIFKHIGDTWLTIEECGEFRTEVVLVRPAMLMAADLLPVSRTTTCIVPAIQPGRP
jgi:hypothetical protein